jgi:hypothetical protein
MISSISRSLFAREISLPKIESPVMARAYLLSSWTVIASSFFRKAVVSSEASGAYSGSVGTICSFASFSGSGSGRADLSMRRVLGAGAGGSSGFSFV